MNNTVPQAWYEGPDGELRRLKWQIKRMKIGDRIRWQGLTIRLQTWGDKSPRFTVYGHDKFLKSASTYQALTQWLDDNYSTGDQVAS